VSERCLCIHGHFYQPPRENPWLEHLEQQESAYPYHDWNQRVTAECYAPNSAARILDDKGRIVRIVNNYALLSFDVGPTLLSWMEAQSPETYAAVLQADRDSLATFDGHGSALAQVYNHLIMPLASRRDKVTQVRWGIRDFERRFGRSPAGMWLAETAVDLETLDIMAEHGIRFTILAPHQAARVRRADAKEWHDVEDGSIDTTTVYVQRLKSGRSMAIFFYNGPMSRAVAFEGLLQNGERFAERLLSGFGPERPEPQLVQIATDGETYGHHHRFGEMALAYALQQITENNKAKLTNYARFLALYPPTQEVEILENTSWSCHHGIERWRADCGCNIGMNAKWNQAWRKPLREALDWLRDELATLFERRGQPLFSDPWLARDAYIEVILERTAAAQEAFFREHVQEAGRADRTTVMKLMEMERHALLMFTSCGWFFDELSRIETIQILNYAARAIQLAHELNGEELEEGFLRRLASARSNDPEIGDGRALWESTIKPKIVSLEQVGAHYAVRSLFASYGEHDAVYCYDVDRNAYHVLEAGRARLTTGQVTVTSRLTAERRKLCFSVLHFGDHTLNGGVHVFKSDQDYQALVTVVTQAFAHGDLAEVIRLLDKHYNKLTYSLGSLFRDQQRDILDLILASTVAAADAAYRQLHLQHAPLMRFLRRMDLPVPRAIHMAGEYVLNTTIRSGMETDELDLERILRLLDEAKEEAISIDREGLGFSLGQAIGRGMEILRARPTDLSVLQSLIDALNLAAAASFELNLWRPQTLYWDLRERVYPGFKAKAETGDERSAQWVARFRTLGEVLKIRVP
jgi:alpha-amylase/alpha-mannosidase (GH57 family)